MFYRMKLWPPRPPKIGDFNMAGPGNMRVVNYDNPGSMVESNVYIHVLSSLSFLVLLLLLLLSLLFAIIMNIIIITIIIVVSLLCCI